MRSFKPSPRDYQAINKQLDQSSWRLLLSGAHQDASLHHAMVPMKGSCKSLVLLEALSSPGSIANLPGRGGILHPASKQGATWGSSPPRPRPVKALDKSTRCQNSRPSCRTHNRNHGLDNNSCRSFKSKTNKSSAVFQLVSPALPTPACSGDGLPSSPGSLITGSKESRRSSCEAAKTPLPGAVG
jgi:hypothetical protein